MSRSTVSFDGQTSLPDAGRKPNRAAHGLQELRDRLRGIETGYWTCLDAPDPIIRAAVLRSGPSGRRGGPGTGRTECRWPPRC